jgi:quercetin dioxygenase-like cupin family protein
MKTTVQIELTPEVESPRGLGTRTIASLAPRQGSNHAPDKNAVRCTPWDAMVTVSRSGHRTFLALAVCATIGFGGATLAEHAGDGHVKVTHLSQRDIIEKLDGKDASATVKEVTFEPGQKDSPHRHAGPVFGYVLEGEYEHAIDDQPVRIYKAGETFYEPSGCVHRVAQNPSGKTRTRLLAVILHPRDKKEVTVPEKVK